MMIRPEVFGGVQLQAVGAAQRLAPFISTECERP
jgi:hypothetical protein